MFNCRCIALDPVIRLVGGISLWSVEIIMQLRVYALFDRNKKVRINFSSAESHGARFELQVALFNGILFGASVVTFICVMIINTRNRGKLISEAMYLPLPGCPTINGGSQWAQWLPGASWPSAAMLLTTTFQFCSYCF